MAPTCGGRPRSPRDAPRTYHDLIGCRHVDVHGDPLHRDNLDAHHRPLGVQHHDQALLGAECVVMGLVIGVGRGDSDRLKDELFATHLHGAVCSSVTMRLRTRIPPTGTDCVVNRSCSSERVTSTVPLAASVTGASGVVLGVVSEGLGVGSSNHPPPGSGLTPAAVPRCTPSWAYTAVPGRAGRSAGSITTSSRGRGDEAIGPTASWET